MKDKSTDDKKTHRVHHVRPDCIGCNMCANLKPALWEMSELDGKADLKYGKRHDNGHEKLEIREEEFEDHLEAAQSCPVNVIHLIEIGSGEQII